MQSDEVAKRGVREGRRGRQLLGLAAGLVLGAVFVEALCGALVGALLVATCWPQHEAPKAMGLAILLGLASGIVVMAFFRIHRLFGAVGFQYGGAVAVIAVLLLVVIIPLQINSDRIDKTNVRQSEVQAVAGRWATDAGWSVTGVTSTGDQVLVEATGPTPAPSLTLLRHDLDAAGLNGLDVRVSLVPASYQNVPK